MYGKTAVEWEQLVDATVHLLEERARAGAVVTYTEVNRALVVRTGQRPFDFSQPDDRAAVGRLLGEAVERTLDEVGAMISAITLYQGGNDPGPGFYALAAEKGLLTPKASPAQRLNFWTGQVNRVYAHYRFL
ncbi:hypothetical protein PWG71_19315 [Nocardiopsis sp. N85]|uniref:hypothetical protein n=1 Tax=Nocardiopsis sp. N85 TaxID=3029400 RepID=UPI00237F1E49|nr:hypothetical protein [Nocardiopsis sp. N85]MDE3723545.1 hypothetical protein [Nocardiopsis sp. N85]